MVEQHRYGRVSALIHWMTALLIIGNLVLGQIMIRAPISSKPVLVPLHAWIGLTVLFLTLVRIAWRIRNPKPPYPADYGKWEIRVAAIVQVLFYVLMIALPVLGYLILSSNPPNPNRILSFWTLFPIPYIEQLQNLDRPVQVDVHDRFVDAHALAGWIITATLALHLAGVVKHQFLDKSDVLSRMGFRRKPKTT